MRPLKFLNELRRKPRRQHRKSGAAMVEFALILPVLVLLLFASMEYGWMFYRESQINGAARHGVRTAVRPGSSEDDVKNAVYLIMNQAGFTSSAYTVTIDNVGGAVGSNVKVVVAVPYANVGLTNFPLLPKPTELRGFAVMAKEGPVQ